jgi:hypothetical protein
VVEVGGKIFGGKLREGYKGDIPEPADGVIRGAGGSMVVDPAANHE